MSLGIHNPIFMRQRKFIEDVFLLHISLYFDILVFFAREKKMKSWRGYYLSDCPFRFFERDY